MRPLTASTHIAAKCQSSAPASQPPSVMPEGNLNGNSGEALYISQPDPTMTATASALIQCVIRTQAGWITAAAGAAGVRVGAWVASTVIRRLSHLLSESNVSAG